MGCSVEFNKKAEKFLRDAPPDVSKRIQERLNELSENPKCEERLKQPLDKLCKTRVGSYRVAYKLAPCTITVVYIGHRRSFYEELTYI